MPFVPQSSMPEPLWFLRQTATITRRTATQESAGSWDLASASTITVQCWLQPNATTDALTYQRETGRNSYTLWLRTKATDGSAITTTQLNHVTSVAVDGITYQVDGEFIDLASNGVVFTVSLFKEV
jgi:hypothetical protein